MGTIFHLHEGLEICGRDESNTFDNLYVETPCYDENGDLQVHVSDETGSVTLTVHKSNIAYRANGGGQKFDEIVEDLKKRHDTLCI